MSAEAHAREVYLDHNATTPIDPRVKAAIDACLDGGVGNPHSSSHKAGWRAREAVDRARRQVAALIGAKAEQIVFTSGSTEANNLAIWGAAAACERGHGGPGQLLYSAIEHPSVREPCIGLAGRGWEVEEVPVRPDGILEPEELARRMTSRTRIVAVMAANHEIGTRQPIETVASLCKARNVILHCDATQAVAKVPLHAEAVGQGLVSLSAHKFYGPMGIGALYIAPGVRLVPMLQGGAQERGLRPGTVPVGLAVGFGRAAEIAATDLTREADRLASWRDRLLSGLRAVRPDLVVNGALSQRLPGNLNCRFPGMDAERLLLAVPELQISTGAACASGRQEPSSVLRALGLTPAEIAASVRICLGRFTTEADLEFALERLSAALES